MKPMLFLIALVTLSACGPGIDREATLTSLRAAIDEEVADEDVLAEHNQLVVTAREGGVFTGMRQFEVEEALGRGQQCGTRALCGDNGFAPTDWTYEIGRKDGLPWGPTLIIGFDRQGFVDGVYTLTRE